MAKKRTRNRMNSEHDLSMAKRNVPPRGFINGLSSPRKGSIWMNMKDQELYEVMSDPLHTSISAIVTIKHETLGVIDIFVTEFYANFTLWKNNIPSKLDTIKEKEVVNETNL